MTTNVTNEEAEQLAQDLGQFAAIARLQLWAMPTIDAMRAVTEPIVPIRKGADSEEIRAMDDLARVAQVGQVLRDRAIAELGSVGRILIAGPLPDEIKRDEGDFTLAIAPIDGILNYVRRGQGTGNPFALCLALVETREQMRFNHIIAAVIADLRQGMRDTWVSWRDTNHRYHTSVNGQDAGTRSEHVVNLNAQVVAIKTQYQHSRDRMQRAFAQDAGNLHSSGCSAIDIANIASGAASAFINDEQSQFVGGAGYAIVKGAGGEVTDCAGNPVDEASLFFNRGVIDRQPQLPSRMPMVFSCNAIYHTDLLRRFNHSG